jgi:S-layer homology domain.
MKRRILAFLAALCLVLGLLPAGALTALAADGLPDLTNLRISAEGVITWDSYPGAARYYLSGGEYWSGGWASDTECRFDFAQRLRDGYAPSGTFTARIYAENDDYEEVACSEITYTHTGLERHPAPANLHWDGYTCRWDPVEEADNGYYVYVYRSDTDDYITSANTDKPYYDASGSLQHKDWNYSFRVQVNGSETGASSEYAECGASIPGRFTLGDLTISLSGDTLSWTPYVDTEGNEAYRYYVYQSDNPEYLGSSYLFGGSTDLRKLLQMRDAPSGTYKYCLEAECREGLEVSDVSNEVTYEYTAEERPSVKMTGYQTRGGYIEYLSLYNSAVYYSDSRTCIVGDSIPFRIIPSEHYLAKGLLVCYGGEEHEADEFRKQTDGSFTGTFRVPNEDFSLKLQMDYDYEDLHSASASFSIAPGQRVNWMKIASDENCKASTGMTYNANERACYGEFLLPGDSVRQILQFKPEYSYQRFAEDTKVQVNGEDAEIIRRDADGRALYVAVDFTVPNEPFGLEHSPTWDRIPNLTVSGSGMITWDAYPGAAMYTVSGSSFFSSDTVTERSFDLAAALQKRRAPSGWYAVEVEAETEDWGVLAYSWIPWYYDGAERIATPQNLRWDGHTAVWDPVEGADAYLVRVSSYPDGYNETEYYAETNTFNLGTFVQEKERNYVFRVLTVPEDDRAYSFWSPVSEPKQGRFIREPLNVTLDGDVLSWPEIVDTEGNPAAHYNLYQFDGPTYLYNTNYTDTSVNLRDMLELVDAQNGEYRFSVTAYSRDGCEVSHESETVTYEYTANSRTTVALQGYSCSRGYTDTVRINGTEVSSYNTYTLTANKLYNLSIRLRDHYVLEDVALRYDGEDHYDAIALERRSDGTYTCRFRAPDKDFNLYFRTEWDWEEVGPVDISFPETPGARMSFNELTPDGECWTYVQDRCCSDALSIYGADYLLPGQKWQVTFRLQPRDGWKRFGEEPTVTVNGKKAEVVKRNDDDRYLFVRYDFEVPQANAVTPEPYDRDYPALENVKVSAQGVVTWDAYPGADHYYVYHGDNFNGGEQDECSFDFRAALDDGKAQTGWYSCIVTASDDADSTIAVGSVAWYYTGREALAAPENLRWEGNSAVWDPVEGADGYRIQVLSLGERYVVYDSNRSETSVDLSGTLYHLEDAYAFRVNAYGPYGGELASSAWSPLSESRTGRFRMEPITITLTGDVLSWPEYIDTEGNPAEYYYIDQYGNPEEFNDSYYGGTTLNLRTALEMVDAPDGDYTFQICAYEKNGYKVSDYSNTVTYHYVDQPRSTVRLTTDFDDRGILLINGIKAWNNDEYTMTVGAEASLELQPSERYRFKEAYLVFGEDEKQELTLTEGADRICTGSFTVPNRKFTLFVRTERIYEKLHSVSVGFSEEPGYLLAMIDLTPEGTRDWSARISGLTGPHGAGNANLRPGGEYEATVDFYIYGDDCRFADDVVAKINGSTCTAENWSDTYFRATYKFTVSSQVSSVVVRGVKAPALEALPEASLGVPGGVFYSILGENEVSSRWRYNDGAWKWMTADEPFRADIAYVLQMEIAPDEGCTFAEDVSVLAEDVDPERIERISVLKSGEPEGSTRTVEITFKPLVAPKPVKTAGCTVAVPVAGGHPDMSPAALDTEQYTVSLYGWYWDMQPGVKLTGSSTFETGCTYVLRVEFKPKEGYFFDEDTVFTINGKQTDSRYGTDYGQVQIDLPAREETPDTFRFEDVKDPGKFYFDPVYWAFNADPQITKGTDDTHFGPDNACTRGHVVTFLWRAAGEPAPKSTQTPFTDLKPGAFYEKAVAWAVEEGITKGLSDTTFGPDATCTRGQIVTFLWRFKDEPAPASTQTPFTDVNPNGYYMKAVAWAVEKGVTKGLSDTTFGPDATCTRGQVVTFLYRATAE